MYALAVVEVNIASKGLTLAAKWDVSPPDMANTFLLQRAVKSFYVSVVVLSVVVRSAEAAMA